MLVGIRFRHCALSSDGFTRYREGLLLHYLDCSIVPQLAEAVCRKAEANLKWYHGSTSSLNRWDALLFFMGRFRIFYGMKSRRIRKTNHDKKTGKAGKEYV